MADDYEDNEDNTGSEEEPEPSPESGGQTPPPELHVTDTGQYMPTSSGADRSAPERSPYETGNIITPGGRPGPGEPEGDTRSRYTATFANGHQMQVIGGGFGGARPPGIPGMPGGGRYPMPPLGQVQLSQAEKNNLQRLQNAQNEVQTRVAEGSLDERSGQILLRQIGRQLQPLQRRQAQSAMAAIHEQAQQAQAQMGHADALQNMRDTQLARAIPNRISTRQLPDGSAVEEFVDSKGVLHATERQKHLWQKEIEQMKLDAAAKKGMTGTPGHEESLAERAAFDKNYHETHKRLTRKDASGNEIPPSAAEVEADMRARADLFKRMHEPPATFVSPVNFPQGDEDRQKEIAFLKQRYPDPGKAPKEVVDRMRQLYGR